MTDKQIAADMAFLMAQAEFRKFLWRTIQLGAIFERTADGSETRSLIREARKDLVLEILAECELGQPAQHPSGQPILTAIQILREEAQQQPTETRNAKRRYDRNAELDDEPAGDADAG